MGYRTAVELARALPAGWMTRQRTAVVDVLVDCHDFVSAQRLHTLMSAAGKRVGLTTVYRALRELEVWGRADVVRDEAGERLYRLRLAEGHRHYLMCRSCGHSRPVDSEVVEAWADRVAAEAGFVAVEHTVELTGICDRCLPASPAADVKEMPHADRTRRPGRAPQLGELKQSVRRLLDLDDEHKKEHDAS